MWKVWLAERSPLRGSPAPLGGSMSSEASNPPG